MFLGTNADHLLFLYAGHKSSTTHTHIHSRYILCVYLGVGVGVENMFITVSIKMHTYACVRDECVVAVGCLVTT